nr:phage baseplate assembly protein V [Bacteroides fragilis]
MTDLGRYRITEITHTVDDKGLYSNTFCGVPGGTPVMPWGDAVMPVAYPEMARVVSNDDPKNQGRVKVQFMWQEIDGGESYWMRVQSPDAGKSDQVARNRGFVFIPEPGDLVMVGFEQGNPDRPYVTGSLFYKANSEGAAKDNTVKSIRTRSGHTLEFNDDEGGDWGIVLKDANENVIHINSKEQIIELTAPKAIILNAQNIKLNAQEDINIVADGKLDVSVAKEGELKFDKLKVDVNNSLDVLSKEYQNESDEVSVISKGKLTLDGKKNTKLGGKKVEVQGSSNKLELP